MESLLREQADFRSRLESREVVWVKIVQVQGGFAHADIGEKHEGVIPLAEFEPGPPPEAGARVPVILAQAGRENKPATLSYKRARAHLGWESAVKAHQEKSRVRGRVASAVKGGFLVDVNGVSAFLPASLADLRPVRKPESMIGTGVRCYIIEINRDKKQLVLSRRAVLEEEAGKRWRELAAKLKVGSVVMGRVAHVSASGVVVNLGGVEGFVPESELAWREPGKAKEALEHGRKLKLKVLRIDPQEKKITLGAKQLLPNPADVLKKKYPPKTALKLTVLEVKQPEGVRLSVDKDATAFCAASELSGAPEPPDRFERRRGPEPRKAPSQAVWPATGEAVQAIVLGVNPATFELSVSIRRWEDMQDRKRVAKYLKTPPPLTLGQILSPEEGS